MKHTYALILLLTMIVSSFQYGYSTTSTTASNVSYSSNATWIGGANGKPPIPLPEGEAVILNHSITYSIGLTFNSEKTEYIF